MLIIGNGTVITRDNKEPIIKEGALAIEGNSILEVGQDTEIKEKYSKAQNVEYIDARGMLVMPGFINMHEHCYSAFARGLNLPGNPPQNFIDILEGTWWRIDRKLSLENVYYSGIATFLEGIRNGVTFVSDHHASFGAIEGSLTYLSRAAKDLNIRSCLAFEVSDRDGLAKRDKAIKENTDYIEETYKQNDSMQTALFGLHASFTLSDETLELCRKANTKGVGYHIHISEGYEDERQCQEAYGCSVVKRLEREKILGENTVAGHCIHISSEDMDILKATKTTVIHNPESNMGNAVGSPDIISMMDKGILVGLGTDGYTHDILESLKVANILQKHRRGLPDRGFVEALQMLANNSQIASKICGKEVGVLKKGALADVIILDYKPNTPMDESNLQGHLMFGINGTMTDTTIVNGRVVMRHREILTVDEPRILAKCQESAQELWSKLI